MSDVQHDSSLGGIRKSRGVPGVYEFHSCDEHAAVSKLRYNFCYVHT